MSSPSDGQIDYSLVVQVNGEFLVGTVATFTCSGGFELVGDAVRECQSDSSWTNSHPTCLSECDAKFQIVVMSLTSIQQKVALSIQFRNLSISEQSE